MSQKSSAKIRTLAGKVVSNQMDKTIVVLVVRRVKYPMYGKIVNRSTKLHAHDERNECSIGDTVVIQETRPISKNKAFKLVSIEERATQL